LRILDGAPAAIPFCGFHFRTRDSGSTARCAARLTEPALLRGVHPAGVIALAVREALAELLLRLRRPMVNVSANLPRPPIPRVGSTSS
jgi:hypothetical protein